MKLNQSFKDLKVIRKASAILLLGIIFSVYWTFKPKSVA
jgi:hypothetical protein